MSYTATRFQSASTLSQISLKEALFEEGYDWDGRNLIDLYCKPGQLSQEMAEQVKLLPEVEFEKLVASLSPGARYMANRIRFKRAEPDLRSLASDWAAIKDIRRWMLNEYNADRYQRLLDMRLARLDENYEIIFEPGKLFHLGIRFAWQAERFVNLYEQVYDKDRVWASSCQPRHGKVKALALTDAYKNLPLWVKKILIESPQWIETERTGDAWRLVDCAKAWRWCGQLPKKIAERIGKMSVKKRVLAAIAWHWVTNDSYCWETTLRDYRERSWNVYGIELSRKNLEIQFWARFKDCCNASVLALLHKIKEYCKLTGHSLRNVVEILLEMPYGSFAQVWEQERRNADGCGDYVIDVIVRYGDKAKACQYLFGCSGKATVKAFEKCQSYSALRWAGAIAYGNPDYVQKFLLLPVLDCVTYQEEAVSFLKSLPLNSALRMVQTTTFKYRGQVHNVAEYHVKDTGYLWNQVQPNPPELGRVRCWLSVHEQLSHEYVERLPDFELKVNPDFSPLHGLSSVDGSWEIVVPTRNAELKLWGQQLDHCVGGYGAAINNGSSVILAIKVNGTVTYTIELTPNVSRYQCRQFYGFKNDPAPRSLTDDVLGALVDAKLLRSTSWGWN